MEHRRESRLRGLLHMFTPRMQLYCIKLSILLARFWQTKIIVTLRVASMAAGATVCGARKMPPSPRHST